MGIESQRISGRMASYIISSRADNTSKKYMNCFKRFEDFCSKRGFVPKPANSNTCGNLFDRVIRQKCVV